jgi:DNA-binding LytR/AlgR family response regulator
MQPIRVIIVDDEPLAIEVLETYIQKIPNLQLLAKCNHALEAFEAIHKHKVDLMLLDIQMPQITGIDFLKTLSNPPKVIFTTAYSNYALDSYELNVVDYLLKPISFERFLKATQKAIQQIQALRNQNALPNSNENEADSENEEATAADSKPDYIFVKADKKLVKLRFEQILFIEGLKDYVMIYTPTGRIITLQTMKSLEEKLPAEHFMRVHRSFIVGTRHIDMLEGNTLLVDKKEIPVGKNYKDELLLAINKNRL